MKKMLMASALVAAVSLFNWVLSSRVLAGEWFHRNDDCERNHFIVSDLDDTIKYTHSNSKFMAMYHMTFSRQIFSGMDELVRRMAKRSESGQPCGDDAPSFAILSAGATFALDKVNSLLYRHQLPKAEVELRNIWSEKIVLFKRDHLKRIYKKRHLPLILLGDDTMHDQEVYQEFVQENPGKVLATYIHTLNHTKALPGQRPFYTAFDVAYAEYMDGRLLKEDILAVGEKILAAQKDKYIIPKFGHCPSAFPGETSDSGDLEIEGMKNAVQTRVMALCLERLED